VKKLVGGLRAWLLQRMSALVMLVLLLCALLVVSADPPHTHHQWQVLIHRPAIAAAAGLFFAALLLHSWIGVRDVVLDYVHPLVLRVSLLVALAAVLLVQALWLLRILL
jgi:succinate dehydrogenase / fumarate reductase, membrane anchor subunit